MRGFPLFLAALSLATGGGVGAAAAATADAGALTLETERVIVYKDGHALVVKRATGTTDAEGRVYLDQVPDAAILGTFWSSAAGRFPIVATTADWVETEELRERETDCVTFAELLRANEGKTARLELSGDRVVTAEIRELLELDPDDSPSPAPSAVPAVRISGRNPATPLETVRTWMPRAGDLVVLAERGLGERVIPVSAISTIQIDGLVTRMRRAEKVVTREKRLTYDLGKSAGGQDVAIRLMYFTPGIRWIPTYRLSGDMEQDAELSLQAELLNELEDIDGAAVDLVVGVPNFRFKGAVSPLSLEGTLRNTLEQAVPGLMSQALANNLVAVRSSEFRHSAGGATDPDVMATAPELDGSGSADLFVYSIPRLSLAKGARATVAVWSDRIALQHLYTLDVDLVRNSRDGSTEVRRPTPNAQGSGSPLEIAHHQVWHQLSLRNSGDAPWTTGAALMLQDGVPLGQDLLTYTPIAGRSLLPVTVAVDVRADLDEVEVSREPNALRYRGNSLTLVRKRGTLTLTNYKREPVRSRARLGMGGRIEEAAADGVVRADDFRVNDWHRDAISANGHADVTWEFELAAGETRTLTYVTSYYSY